MIVKNIYESILDKFEKKMEKAKEILPSTCRIGKTIFTSMAVIGGKICSNHPQNLNHVRKDSKCVVSIIITLGKIYNWRGHYVL